MEQLLSIVRHRFAKPQSNRYENTFIEGICINGIWFETECTPHL